MTPSTLPLNALRAFEASARHLNFTRAAEELCVTQGAVSHQVRALEARLGVTLFRRLARGLALTDEAEALIPVLTQSFARIGELLDQVQAGRAHQTLTIGVVNTFAVGWLLPRLEDFRAAHPFVDLRLRRPDRQHRIDEARRPHELLDHLPRVLVLVVGGRGGHEDRLRHQALELVEQRGGLCRLAALPVLVAIPSGVSRQHGDQQPGDQVAILLPEVLELVELFLFFEVEMVGHGKDRLSRRL
mgnify:CR=1 FL=1